MTLYFHNPIFVKWKPTVIYWIFGLVFLGSHFIGNKTLIQRLFATALEKNPAAHKVPVAVWKRLNVAWALFFTLLGLVNLWVAYHFSTDAWVNFKLYGVMGALLLFSVIQAFYLARFITDLE
jgi:intracellular septation protein